MKNIYRLIANIIFAITIFLTINITYAEDGVADGTTFINGGIGQEEADEIRAKAGTFNLHIYMSEGKNGQSITGVEVAIIDKKGEIKVRSDFTSANSVIQVKANVTADGSETIDIELIVNIDLPNRNVFRRIDKMHPKITMLVWKESQKAYRYATILEADGAKAIWCGYYTNYKYLS